MRALREGIEKYCQNDSPLLLGGPPGAGQEAVARAIHRKSSRNDRPFIYVSCAHLSDPNESFFGSNDPSGQAARSDKASLANGGTLYLEGIETLSDDVAQKLLDLVTQTVGCNDNEHSSLPDTRIIAYSGPEPHASSYNAEGSMSRLPEERVASDLHRMLSQNRLLVPSLNDRRDDIVDIANHIVEHRARAMGKPIVGLDTESQQRLCRYSWPGNLRELRSLVERAVMLASGAQVEIPEELLQEGRRVGGYTLKECLARGGMGEVWLAQHALLARPSAVKLIRKESYDHSSDAREMLEERFRREARATAQLRPPTPWSFTFSGSRTRVTSST